MALFLVFIFLVTGADAGTIVLGSMSAGGVLNPTTRIKLTWGVIMAALAAALLLAGSGGAEALSGLTNGTILAATPFGIIMVPMCYGLYRTLKTDYREERRELQQAMAYDREMELQQMREIMAGPPPAPGLPHAHEPAARAEPEREGVSRVESSESKCVRRTSAKQGVSPPGLVACCVALGPRWCQSSVNAPPYPPNAARSALLSPDRRHSDPSD